MFPLLFRRSLPAMALVTLAAGCATVPTDRGSSDVSALTLARGGPAVQLAGSADAQAKAQVSSMLARELTAAESLQIALLNSPRARSEFSRLGIASAEVLEAGRLSNPTLSVSVLRPNTAGEANQMTFGLAQSFTDLLFLPSRSRLARGEYERAKAEASSAILKLARDVEAAHVRLASAQQISVMRSTVAKAARASADLAQRYFDAGNITDLALSLEKAAAAQAELSALSAAADVVGTRSALNVLMGLPSSETRWSVATTLPLPVAQEDDVQVLQALAEGQQLDLIAARQEVALFKDAAGVTRSFRYLGNVEVGVETERETDRSRLTGPTLALELPIFNQNQGGVLRADAQLELAEARLQEKEVEISNAIALAAAKVDNARRTVELLRDQLVPMRERVVQRTQEQVNYMLVGIFDLVRAKQEEYDAYEKYLGSIRDYWLSRTELALAVGSALPSSATVGSETVSPIEPVEPPASGGHSGHNMGGMKGMAMPDGMDMSGMKGMDHSGHNMSSGSAQKSDPHAGHQMEGMEGMGDMDMQEMDGMEGMDMSGMKGMDHKPAAKPSTDKACENLKKADPKDPLTQALKKKCQKPAAKSDHSQHSSPKTDSATPPADDHSSHGESHH